MPVTLRIAFRNLFEHRSKSLIIGILLALGALVLVMGNAFIDASREGIRATFIDNYTGDVFVSGVSDEGSVSLFGVSSAGGLAATPVIPDYDKVLATILASPAVDKATGMATSYGIVTSEGETPAEAVEDSSGDSGARMLFFFGIDALDYWQLFDSIDITAGELLKPGQNGLIINEAQLTKLSEWMKRPIGIGDSLVVQAFSSAGMKLRELPIVAAYKQKNEGAVPEQMAFVDIDTLRVMAGMTVGANENISLKPSDTAMLGVEDTNSLFADDLFESAPSAGAGSFDEQRIQAQLADTSLREKANTADTGAWHFIVIKTKNPADAPALIQSLNRTFQSQGIAAAAGDWQKAAGPYGQSVDVIRVVFIVAIVILAVVAVIIIMNTFVISVIERTGEIGTMRAIGAKKGFIRKLFAAEAAVLALSFSFIGALVGSLAVVLLRALKLEAGNPFLQVLFGGKHLAPFVTPFNFATAILVMLAVGYIAHLYPVSVALKIEPVRAMQQE